MKLRIVSILGVLLVFLSVSSPAQELECAVTINTDLLTAEARENLQDFASQVQSYINSFSWSNADIAPEKIKWSMSISFQGSPSQNRYTAQAFIGSQRPIYRSEKNTALLRVLDDRWEFSYQRGQQMLHDETSFNSLLSFLDYYSYIILGLDFESYREGDGLPYLEKAMNVVNTASSGGKGWVAESPSTYSRGEYIDELLSSKYEPVRSAIFRYHYLGLDLMYADPARAKTNILNALKKLGRVMSETNQPSQVIKIFFDTKYLEIAETFRGDADLEVFNTLIEIDPAHRQTYEDTRDASP
jgi:hypothetical protein